jgi:uncharacterized protein YbaA (DUF1428 family)
MTYIDGFVTPATADRETYRAFAARAAAVLREHGAIRIVEAWGDDVPDGEVTDFRGAVKAEAGETVAFSWIEWPDKATRDAGMAKVMADPRMDFPPEEMPFAGKRMIYGGFDVIVDA